jgi:serine phosphatase RsbU (regulator of sigma subunit)
MTLAAEMRWSMLPPLTYTGPGVTIAGVLEPAYEIAGDTFDYGVNGDHCHVAIIDAMGHGLEASMMASLAVSSYRHSRRAGLTLEETLEAMDAAVASQFPEDRFVTAQLATLHVPSGELRYGCAGHPATMLVRNGRMIGDLATAPAPPLGLGLQRPEVLSVSLEPGDRLLFLSDGAIEARAPDGELFGRERLGDLLGRAVASGFPPSEVMRRLMNAVLEHQQGVLQDDATLLLLEWPDDLGDEAAGG